MKIRNTFIIFIVSGFWHGANWTFIIWGGLNALYFLPLLLTKNNRNNLDIVAKGKHLPNLKELFSMLLTFGLTILAWIFFRANNVEHAIDYISAIFTYSLFSIPTLFSGLSELLILVMIVIFLIVEWMGRERQYAIEKMAFKQSSVFRWMFYLFICLMIIFFQGKQQEFIYFQF